MKICFKCKEEKELIDFYRHQSSKDGRVNKCKECTKKDVALNRLKNIDRIREYDRNRGNRQDKGYLKKWRGENPNKYKAHSIVNYAIKSKKLFREPCIECGELKSVAHHDDYLKPLNVRWMCQAHHKQWHSKNGEGINP